MACKVLYKFMFCDSLIFLILLYLLSNTNLLQISLFFYHELRMGTTSHHQLSEQKKV
jgi:hypothetical protein